jgi:hypothetical protein
MKKAGSLLVLLSLCIATFAGDIDKAFKALNTGDYPNALKFLREVLSEEGNNVAARYGMAKYYFSKDNKGFNLDSANIYVTQAYKALPLNPEAKETKKYTNLGVRDYTIQALFNDVNRWGYDKAEQENTVESYQYFIDRYKDQPLVSQATTKRNALAYVKASATNTMESYEEFLKKYPDATEAKDAKVKYDKMVYDKMTADKSYSSYKAYMDKYPTGPYFAEAKAKFDEKIFMHYVAINTLEKYKEFEKQYPDNPNMPAVQDSIYSLNTVNPSIGKYKTFIDSYPKNRNVNKAWDELYTLYTANATPEVYTNFESTYTKFPFADRLKEDKDMAKMDVKPFANAGKMGYVTVRGTDSFATAISFDYNEAYPFNSGLAAVRDKPCTDDQCTYYYINKKGNKAFDKTFNYAGDFINGIAVVGIGNCESDGCKFGIIDKKGRFIVAPVYDEIEEPSEGLYLASKDDKYGFINETGEEVISLKYTNALPFSQGLAAVALNDNWFFIDKNGRQPFIQRFKDVLSYSDSVAAVTPDGETWGYIDMNGKFIIEPVYEDAEDFVGGFGVVSKREQDKKDKTIFVNQRYKIDKAGKLIEKITAPKPAAKTKGRRKK